MGLFILYFQVVQVKQLIFLILNIKYMLTKNL